MDKISSNELLMLQSLPFEIKVAKSKIRIREIVQYYGDTAVCFSGGIDSTVLLHLVRNEYPNVPAVCIYALENKDNRAFIDTVENVIQLKPGKPMVRVIEEDGYPIGSKRIAKQIRQLQNPTPKNEKSRTLALTGVTSTGRQAPRYKLPKRWQKLITSPFKISHKCCIEMKEKPLAKYQKETGAAFFIGEMAADSETRRGAYLKTGCNSFSGFGKSKPLGFWTKQDILRYMVENKLSYSASYGEILQKEDGTYYTTKADRTGCDMCAFGVQFEKYPNRYQRMFYDDPGMWNFAINTLGYGSLLDFMEIPYYPNGEAEVSGKKVTE